MIKAVIRYALKCLLLTEMVMAYISAIVYLTTNHKTNVWEIYLQSQVVVAGLVIASTTAYVVSYRIARIKRQKRIESLAKDMKSNPEFMDAWNEFKKSNGTDMSRLTEKVKNTDDYIKLPTKDKQEFIDKLGKLEDLMEKYHIRDVEHLDRVLEGYNFAMLGKIFPSYLQKIEKESK